jgi:hypothetical protein
MTPGTDPLDRLAPALPWTADWNDVLSRAGDHPPSRPLPRRLPTRGRLVVALVVLAAVLIPLAALAAANEWWFLNSGSTPKPVHAPAVVKEGEWSGHSWQLIAYPSGTDGLCFSLTPKGSAANGAGGALSCSPFVGVARTRETKAAPDMTITFLSGTHNPKLPSYVVGPVIERAAEVELHFANGEVLRVPTFGASGPLEHVRFYATQVPASWFPSSPPGLVPLFDWIAGLDKAGNVVACLAPATAKDGMSPLSDCR